MMEEVSLQNFYDLLVKIDNIKGDKKNERRNSLERRNLQEGI